VLDTLRGTPTLHIHVDESGDLRFTPTGTRHYVFAAAWTYDPAPLANGLTALRFALVKQGHNLSRFHASEDKQVNRNAVVGTLARYENWHHTAIVIEKAKVYPELRDPHHFYPTFAMSVLKYIFHRHVRPGTTRVLVFTDTLPVKARRDAAEKAIKLACRRELDAAIRFESFHHPCASNAWIQVADYCSWAVFRKWEFGDPRTYEQLRVRLADPELDALRLGTIQHY
jgi:hypothetical protein